MALPQPVEDLMAKQLSEQLAELSLLAKSTEAAVVAAQKEALDKIVAGNGQARAATKVVATVYRQIKSVGGVAARNWSADQAKIAAEIAVDYAIASVEQAKLAVLDAIDARAVVEEAKQMEGA
jgi:hypothetical protein